MGLLARQKLRVPQVSALRRTHREATRITTKSLLFLIPPTPRPHAQALEVRGSQKANTGPDGPCQLPRARDAQRGPTGAIAGTHRGHGRDTEGGEGHTVFTRGWVGVHPGRRNPEGCEETVSSEDTPV